MLNLYTFTQFTMMSDLFMCRSSGNATSGPTFCTHRRQSLLRTIWVLYPGFHDTLLFRFAVAELTVLCVKVFTSVLFCAGSCTGRAHFHAVKDLC